jgi:hypothetical protein
MLPKEITPELLELLWQKPSACVLGEMSTVKYDGVTLPTHVGNDFDLDLPSSPDQIYGSSFIDRNVPPHSDS